MSKKCDSCRLENTADCGGIDCVLNEYVYYQKIPYNIREDMLYKFTESLADLSNVIEEKRTYKRGEKHIDQHEAGAKLDSDKPRTALVLNGFSKALLEVSKVGTFGANKYSDNGWKEVPNGVERYSSALLRHYLAEQTEYLDSETNLSHAAAVAWNALARLELILNEQSKTK